MANKLVAVIAVVVVIALVGAGIAIFLLNGDKPKDINTIEDLKGAKIGVQTGTTGDLYVTDEYEANNSAKISRYTAYPDVFTDLKNKKIDAIVMDKAPAEAYIKKYEGLKILDDILSEEDYGFIFNKSTGAALRDEFNTAMASDDVKDQIAKIKAYWYDHSTGEAEPYVNSTGTGTKITVATSPDFPPYDALYNNKFTGIDMDIIRAICNKLNYQVEFKNVDFDSVITEVISGTSDMGASGISITDERSEKVLFSTAYENSQIVVVARA